MRKKIKFPILFFALVSTFAGQAKPVSANDEKFIFNSPRQLSFERYPANIVQLGDAPKPVLITSLAKKYKSAITVEAVRPVNFAGHYRVATWACGTDCRGFAIINKQTGTVYTLPGVEYVAGVMGNDEERFSYRVDSNLFIITGMKNDDEKEIGKFFYLWKKGKLTLLAKAPISTANFFAPGADPK